MPIKNKKLTVKESNAGQRLDIFLAKKLKISRSQAQKMLEAEQVLVNDKLPKKAGDNLSVGSIVTVIPTTKEESLSKKQTDRDPSSAKASLGMTPAILAETPDYIVVNKPTGMLSHPTMAGEKNTVADFIVKKYPEVKKIGDSHPSSASPRAGEENLRPGIVHRLDKEASGLMVIARTQKMFNHLKGQFKNRTIEKEYYALVHGRVARDWGEIDFPIARSETAERMAAVPSLFKGRARVGSTDLPSIPSLKGGDAREAKTEFWVEKKFTNFTLLKIKIHTGRMHQIRVHMLAYNHPLVGDPIYFQKKQKRTWDEKLGRLFLHAAKLGFTDLAGERQEFASPLPKELDEFLKLLK